MGLRGKVTLTLVIIVFIQISCKRCMQRTPSKSSLKQYLNNLKSVKNNPTSPLFTKTSIYENKDQNANSQQYSRPHNMYEAYNFPEIEYPLDTSEKDPFNYKMKINSNYQVNNDKQKESGNFQNAAINDFKKKLKMQRKLSSYRKINSENYQPRREISPTNYESGSDPIRFPGSGIFPEVQYPGNAKETWGPNYWSYLPFTQEKQQFNGLEQQTFYPKAKEHKKKPLTKLSKAKAYEFLQPYHKLKEQKRISTESSKRSSLDEKGIHFTKTPTCEKLLEDFITESIVSSISSTSSDAKQMLKSIIEVTPSSRNAYEATEYAKQSVPIPYKVVTQDNNANNVCPIFEKKNTSKVNDMHGSYVTEALSPELLQSAQDKPFIDGICTEKPKNTVPDNINTINTTKTLDYGFANTPSAIAVVESAKTYVNAPVEELLVTVPDKQRCDILPGNITLIQTEEIPMNISTIVSPVNVTKSISFVEPVPSPATTNVAISHPTEPAPLSNAGTTSIIIIPINCAVSKPQSHFFETTANTSVIVYIPTSQASGVPSQTLPVNQYVSSALEQMMQDSSQTFSLNSHVLSTLTKTMSYNNQSSAISDMIALLNNNTFAPASLSEKPTKIPLLQKYESLPANSMCYKSDKSPLLLGETSSLDKINKTMTDTLSSNTQTCDEKLSVSKGSLETRSSEKNASPIFFYDSDLNLLNDEPHNSVLINDLPIVARQVNMEHLMNGSYKNIDIQPKNVMPAYLQDNIPFKRGSLVRDYISKSILPKSHDVELSVSRDNNFSAQTACSDVEIQTKNNTTEPTICLGPLMNALSVPMDKPLTTPPLSGAHNENVSIIHETFPAIQTIVTSTEKLVQLMDKTHLSSAIPDTLAERLPLSMDENCLSKTSSDSLIASFNETSLSKNTSEESQLFVDFPQPINAIIQPTPIYTDTSDQPLSTDNKCLSITQNSTNKSSDILRFPINRTLSSIPASEIPNDTHVMDRTLSSTIVSDSHFGKLKLLSENKTTITTSTKKLTTGNKPCPMKKTQSPTPSLTHNSSQNSSLSNTPTHDLPTPIDEAILLAPIPETSVAKVLPVGTGKTFQLMNAPLLIPTSVCNTSTNEKSQLKNNNSSPENLSVDKQINTFFVSSSNSTDGPIDKKLSSNLVLEKPIRNMLVLPENSLSHNPSEPLLLPSDNNILSNNNTCLGSNLCVVSSNSLPTPSAILNEYLDIPKPTKDNLYLRSIVDLPLLVKPTMSGTPIADDFSFNKPLPLNNLLPSSQKTPAPSFRIPVNSLNNSFNQSLPKTFSSDLETNRVVVPIGSLQTSVDEDSLPTNISLHNGSALIEGSLLPTEKNIDKTSGNLLIENDDTPVSDYEVQNTSLADGPIDNKLLSLDHTSPFNFPVNKVLPQFLPVNVSINNIVFPVKDVLPETPILNTDTEDQPSLVDDSQTPDDALLLDILTTDYPNSGCLTDMNQALPKLADKEVPRSPMSSDFDSALPDSTASNMTSNLPSDNIQQPLLSDIDNGSQPIDKLTSKCFICNDKIYKSKPLVIALPKSFVSANKGLIMKFNKSVLKTPVSGSADGSWPMDEFQE